MNNYKTREEIEKEFDEKWPHLEMWTEHAKPMQCERKVKDFIHSIRSQDRITVRNETVEEVRKEVEKMAIHHKVCDVPRKVLSLLNIIQANNK